MARTLPIAEVKARLPELVTGVQEHEEEIVVTRKGKPAAVLVSYGEYERLKDTIDVLSDADLMRQIRRSRRFYAAGAGGCPSSSSSGNRAVSPRGAPVSARLSPRHSAPRGGDHSASSS